MPKQKKEEKNKGGRPRLFKTPSDMQKGIDAYFDECKTRRQENPLSAPPTISGLCYYLGFEDRHALAQYEKYDGFSATIKRARLRLENILEECLFGGQVTGVIFNLKNNYGWKDSQQLEHTGKDGGPMQTQQVAPDYAGILDEVEKEAG